MCIVVDVCAEARVDFLHKTATHNGWRVVIVDEAQALNRHGQNAILKILEEPPPRALILMTTTSPGALLPTIRSRCRLLTAWSRWMMPPCKPFSGALRRRWPAMILQRLIALRRRQRRLCLESHPHRSLAAL